MLMNRVNEWYIGMYLHTSVAALAAQIAPGQVMI